MSGPGGSEAAAGAATESWDSAFRQLEPSAALAGWRAQSDAANRRMIETLLPRTHFRSALKTDLFDEACSTGLVGALAERSAAVTGIDVSAAVVAAAEARHPNLRARAADVRSLPFGDGEFDLVLSNSTLDHFDGPAQLARALAELGRVTEPGGSLLITLDNPLNPLIALRNRAPARVGRALRGVPYGAGWTCGPRRLRRLLAGTGWRPQRSTAIVHAPRFLVAALGHRAERPGGGAAGWIVAAEGLSRLPTRYLSGHFIAVLATRDAGLPTTLDGDAADG